MQTIISEEKEINAKNKILIEIKIETLLSSDEYKTISECVKTIKKVIEPHMNEIEKRNHD